MENYTSDGDKAFRSSTTTIFFLQSAMNFERSNLDNTGAGFQSATDRWSFCPMVIRSNQRATVLIVSLLILFSLFSIDNYNYNRIQLKLKLNLFSLLIYIKRFEKRTISIFDKYRKKEKEKKTKTIFYLNAKEKSDKWKTLFLTSLECIEFYSFDIFISQSVKEIRIEIFLKSISKYSKLFLLKRK